jgi:subtilisin family serine protease
LLVTRKLLVLLVVIATAFALAVPGLADDEDPKPEPPAPVAQGEFNSYIVVLQEDPLIVDIDPEDLDTSAAEAQAADLIESHDEVIEEAGLDTEDKVHDYVNALNGFSVLMTHSEAERVAANSKVAMVLPDELQQVTTDSSPSFLGLTGKGGAWAAGYTGKGVVVGVIDTGIWPEHPSFADNGMPAPSIDVTDLPCEFGNTGGNFTNPDDAPFTCNNKLLGARQMLDTYRMLVPPIDGEFDSARDDDGHGTHTASTAAGDAGVDASIFGQHLGTISGMAPDAAIISYKGLGAGGGFTSDLASAIDQAVEDGVDVINYSIGGGSGPIGADEVSFLFAADADVFVATSAGNSGPGEATLGSPAEVPWLTTVGANTQKRFFEGTVTLKVKRDFKSSVDEFDKAQGRRIHGEDQYWMGFWGWYRHHGQRYRNVDFSGASVTLGTGWAPLVDGADAGSDVCAPDELDPDVVVGAIVLCRRGDVDRADKSLAVQIAGGVGMVQYNNDDNDNLFTDNHSVPSVHVNFTDGTKIKDLIGSDSVQSAKIETGDVSKFKAAPSTTYFSSRGPNQLSPDLIKPDLTAPGLQILAGASPVNLGNVQGELFQAIAGTSMSSPHVAGIFALIKQAHPDWTAAMAKSALMTSADTDVVTENLKTQANPFQMGAGMVHPGGNQKGSAFQPGLVYDAGLLDYVAYTCGEDFGVFTTGSCDFVEGLGFPLDPSDLNVPSIGIAELAGAQTVTRTVTSVANKTQTYKVKVEAPKGYKVEVSPSTITLAPGDSASYEVTFTNKKAPLDEWRFGSLTWNSGKYQVRSPIALKAAAFDSPDEVSGTGTDGTTSFGVLFGYTGPYVAEALGLSPDTGASGSVVQDPDQTWPSGDDGAGVATHDFTLTGSAILRITMSEADLTGVDPANTDIDLYLYKDGDPTNVVAASTNGGTDETIEMVNPEDGNYTLVVHGWQVKPDGSTAGYTFHLWDVPNTGGGSLQIDSAPTSAVTGSTGTIDLSWAGLEPGSYLGAVAHGDGTQTFGYTLVSVDAN